MNTHGYKFIAAAAVAAIYMALASGFVREDRRSHTGGFINLRGMVSCLVTLPVSFPLEYLGTKIDYRSNWQIGSAILICGVLCFALTFGALNLGEFIWMSPSAPR